MGAKKPVLLSENISSRKECNAVTVSYRSTRAIATYTPSFSLRPNNTVVYSSPHTPPVCASRKYPHCCSGTPALLRMLPLLRQPVFPMCSKQFHRHYSGQRGHYSGKPALLRMLSLLPVFPMYCKQFHGHLESNGGTVAASRHYSACCHYYYRFFPCVPTNFTGTIAGDGSTVAANRHYSACCHYYRFFPNIPNNCAGTWRATGAL